MKAKKLGCLLLSVVLAGGLLVGCGSKSDSTSGKIETVEDLSGKSVGVQTGTTGDLYMTDDDSLKDVKVERYNKGFEAVLALSQGKIDAVVIDDQPAQKFVAEAKGLKILDTPYTVEDYAICFAKDSKLTEEFNQAIKALKEEGTFDKIVAYYIDGEGDEPYKSPEGTKYPNGTLTMATNAEFPPYEYYGDNDEIEGIDIDFAKAICDKLGYELKIEDMAFDAILVAIQSGKADFGAAGMTVTDERKEQVDFSDSYYTGKQAIIVAQ